MIVLSRSPFIVNYCKKNNKLHNQNHGSRRIKCLSHFTVNYFGNSGSTASYQITIQEKKNQAISHFTGEKIGHSRITKIPFITFGVTSPGSQLRFWYIHLAIGKSCLRFFFFNVRPSSDAELFRSRT